MKNERAQVGWGFGQAGVIATTVASGVGWALAEAIIQRYQPLRLLTVVCLSVLLLSACGLPASAPSTSRTTQQAPTAVQPSDTPTPAALGSQNDFPVGHMPTAVALDGANMWVVNQRSDTVSER